MSALARELGGVALRWWWLILLCGATTGGFAYVASRNQEPVYEASTTLIVGRSLEASNLDPREVQSNELLAQTYANIARRQPVLQGVVDELALDVDWRSLRQRIRANPIESTQLFEIVAEARSRGEAESIADETAQQLIKLQTGSERGREGEQRRSFISDQLRDLSEKIAGAQEQVDGLESTLLGSLSGEERQRLREQIAALEQQIADWRATYADLLANDQPSSDILAVVESARATSRRVRVSLALSTVAAGILGVLIGLGAAALWERSTVTVRSGGEVSRELGMAFLGGVRRIKSIRRANLATGPTGLPSPAADDYRILRSNIESLSLVNPIKFILVTSPAERGPRTTTVSNLGVVMAQAGLRTVLVDADIRQPMLHEIFDVAESPGLTDYLGSTTTRLKGKLKPTSVENLQVLPTGSVVPDPAALLDSPRMSRLLELLDPVADIVILDSPSPLNFPDAVLLSKHVDGVILVITAGRTRLDAAQSSVMLLERAGARLLGGVLHSVPTQIASDGYAPPRRPTEAH